MLRLSSPVVSGLLHYSGTIARCVVTSGCEPEVRLEKKLTEELFDCSQAYLASEWGTKSFDEIELVIRLGRLFPLLQMSTKA